MAEVARITRFYGLNESPAGSAALKPGEAAELINFRITDEGCLALRPGLSTLYAPAASPVKGLYSTGTELLAVSGGKLWRILDGSAEEIGPVTGTGAFFFGFQGRVYLLTGSEYLVYDGESLKEVEGYIPLVAVSAPPSGGGTLLEPVNKLTGKKRQRFSPDGTAAAFKLAEEDIDELIGVEGTELTYSTDLAAGTVTFESAPPAGTNSLEITWRRGAGDRAAVEAMRFAETYNGPADTRVFLGGSGNRLLYSGIEYSGEPSAEYFPDLNVLDADSANTPVTGLTRHFDRLLIFKPDGVWGVEYGELTLADGSVESAFYTTAVNREYGGEAPGQVCILDNDPYSLSNGSVVRWRLGSSTTHDERSSEVVSGRVSGSMRGLPLKDCVCFSDSQRRELYLFGPDRTLVYSAAADAWYRYGGFAATAAVRHGDDLVLGLSDGRVAVLDERYRNDDGAEIEAEWVSGSMALSQSFDKKYSPGLWLTMKPESGGRITVRALTDRRAAEREAVIACSLASFTNLDFSHFSFATTRRPRLRRARLKARRFAYYTLCFSSCSASAAATVLGADIEFEKAGEVRR